MAGRVIERLFPSGAKHAAIGPRADTGISTRRGGGADRNHADQTLRPCAAARRYSGGWSYPPQLRATILPTATKLKGDDWAGVGAGDNNEPWKRRSSSAQLESFGSQHVYQVHALQPASGADIWNLQRSVFLGHGFVGHHLELVNLGQGNDKNGSAPDLVELIFMKSGCEFTISLNTSMTARSGSRNMAGALFLAQSCRSSPCFPGSRRTSAGATTQGSIKALVSKHHLAQ